MADETLDLDELERLARSPEGDDGLDWSDDYKAATCPAAVVALVERLRVAEHRVTVLRAYCEGGITFACLTAEDIADALGLPEPEVPDGTD